MPAVISPSGSSNETARPPLGGFVDQTRYSCNRPTYGSGFPNASCDPPSTISAHAQQRPEVFRFLWATVYCSFEFWLIAEAAPSTEKTKRAILFWTPAAFSSLRLCFHQKQFLNDLPKRNSNMPAVSFDNGMVAIQWWQQRSPAIRRQAASQSVFWAAVSTVRAVIFKQQFLHTAPWNGFTGSLLYTQRLNGISSRQATHALTVKIAKESPNLDLKLHICMK